MLKFTDFILKYNEELTPEQISRNAADAAKAKARKADQEANKGKVNAANNALMPGLGKLFKDKKQT